MIASDLCLNLSHIKQSQRKESGWRINWPLTDLYLLIKNLSQGIDHLECKSPWYVTYSPPLQFQPPLWVWSNGIFPSH